MAYRTSVFDICGHAKIDKSTHDEHNIINHYIEKEHVLTGHRIFIAAIIIITDITIITNAF